MAKNGPFLGGFWPPKNKGKTVQSQNRFQHRVPTSGQLLVATTRPASGSTLVTVVPKVTFWSQNVPTLSPFLRAFPSSNFKFRPIFGKLRELSFTVVDTRNRHFHSIRAKNRPQKEQLAKISKNSIFIFWPKMVGNVSKRALQVKFWRKN